MRFGLWRVRSLYRSGSPTAVVRELAKYKLDLVGVQEVRWDKGGTVRAGDYILFLWKRKRKSSVGNRIFVRHRLVSAVTRVEFVSDRILYIVLRGSWYNIIALNVHASSDYSKDSFYEEL
jgi:exonuclease III